MIGDLQALASAAGAGGGSNNWVLSGARTATGRPLLANDPHLPPTIPGLFYLAHVSTPDWRLVGATTVGTPGLVSGHNGHAAWGVTSGMADVADLTVEEIGPDGTTVRDGQRFVPCEVQLATANNKPLPDGAEPYLGDDWMNGYRAQAIHDALAGRDDWDLAAMQALQQDTRSLPWEELRPLVLALGANASAADGREASTHTERARRAIGCSPPGTAGSLPTPPRPRCSSCCSPSSRSASCARERRAVPNGRSGTASTRSPSTRSSGCGARASSCGCCASSPTAGLPAAGNGAGGRARGVPRAA